PPLGHGKVLSCPKHFMRRLVGEYESALTVHNRNRHAHIVENGLKQCLRLEPQEGWHSGDPGFTGAVTYSGSRRQPQSTTPNAQLTVASSVWIEQPSFPKWRSLAFLSF